MKIQPCVGTDSCSCVFETATSFARLWTSNILTGASQSFNVWKLRPIACCNSEYEMLNAILLLRWAGAESKQGGDACDSDLTSCRLRYQCQASCAPSRSRNEPSKIASRSHLQRVLQPSWLWPLSVHSSSDSVAGPGPAYKCHN
eukprot:6196900-Pleurochrysis_carterae.AAC.3